MRTETSARNRRIGLLRRIAGLAAIVAGLSGRATAADPPPAADELLRLVPPDAGLVIAVEGLRDHVRSLAGSRLVADLRRLPAVRGWLESDAGRHLRQSGADVEGLLGVKLSELRDQLLGDAVVLSLRLPPDGPPDPSRARGLLLLRARDPSLPGRVLDAVNAAQTQSGELARVDVRHRGDATYHVRAFPEASGRPSEYYIGYPDGTFAFSNSEEMIQRVADRKPDGTGTGLAASPRWIAVRRRLPEHALARLFVDPRAVERLLAHEESPPKPSDLRAVAMLRRHLAAVDYAGAALVWRSESITIHAVETLDPSRVDAWLRRWASDGRRDRPELRRVPTTAMAIASAHVDGSALREALDLLVPESEHQRLRNLEAVLTGLLLGQDFATRILPRLGPGVVAYLEAPTATAGTDTAPRARGSVFPLVIAVSFSDRTAGPDAPAVSDAIENALRTILVFLAMDEKRGGGRAGLATTRAAVASVTTLDIPVPLAFAIDRDGGRLVLGTSAAAVARYLEAGSDPEAGARFRDWRASAFPAYETFVCIDLDALTRHAGQLRGRLARRLAGRQDRPADEVASDLEHLGALARLFRAAFFASRIEPDASALHRCFGVILKE